MSPGTRVVAIFLDVECVASRIQIGLLDAILFCFRERERERERVCVIGDARCNNCSFTLEGISQHGPEPWTPKVFTEVNFPESSHPLEHIWFTKSLHTSYLLLNLSSHPDITNEIQMVPDLIFFDFIMV